MLKTDLIHLTHFLNKMEMGWEEWYRYEVRESLTVIEGYMNPSPLGRGGRGRG